MTAAVVTGAIAVAAFNLLTGLIGAFSWYTGAPAGTRPVAAFWLSLRIAQAGSVLLAAAVGVIAATGSYSTDHLFYLYALLPLAVAFVAEQLRIASAQTILDQRGLADAAAVGSLAPEEQRGIVDRILHREMGVMALSALVVVFLALRAAGTAHGF